MRIVLAPDSFKESLAAPNVCEAMEKGVRRVFPHADIDKIPFADGGEGTVDAFLAASPGSREAVNVIGPTGKSGTAEIGLLGDGTAVIEMASASGLQHVPMKERNPLLTTTYGTGQLILAALKMGIKKIIVGIGGSATVDCGTGMAQALGIIFKDKNGRSITEPLCGGLLQKVRNIEYSNLNPLVKEAEIIIASDVTNPLLGPSGAVFEYARQKGATDEQLEILEKNMGHIISIIENGLQNKFRDIPGAGAAGGLGAGLMAFLGARMRSGVELLLEHSRFEERISGTSLILTGEGKIDGQTAAGKTIWGIAKTARQHDVPVIAVTGSFEGNVDELYNAGLTSVFSIYPGPLNRQFAMDNAALLIENCVARIMLLLEAYFPHKKL